MLKGLFFIIFLTLAATSSWILITPTILFMMIPIRLVISLRRQWIALVSGIFFDFAGVLLALLGTKVFVYCDNQDILKDTGVVIISNHRTRVDWMYAGWLYGYIIGVNPDQRVILKDTLRSVPIYGWCMQIMMYIFLTRKKENNTDIPHISNMITYLSKSSPTKPSLLLFPEGTDLSKSNIEKNNEYARKNNLQETQQILYPKPGGLLTCLNSLPDQNNIVHDVTIAYKDYHQGKRTSEASLLNGEFPREIHLNVKRYTKSELPSSEKDIKKWLTDKFLEKEEILQNFYENNSRVPQANDKLSCKWPPLLKYNLHSRTLKILLIIISWILLTFTSFYYIAIIRWYVFFMMIICVSAKSIGGLDVLELTFHSKLINKNNN
jgi:lysocardiolipin and lysophospholipid acyltransferase